MENQVITREENRVDTRSESSEQIEKQQKQRLRVLTPAVTIRESNEEVMLLADMPGVDQSGLEVTLEKNLLTIEGRMNEPQLDGVSLVWREFGHGLYQRTFTISDEIDRDSIEARIRNGRLELKLRRARPAKRRIEVQAG